MSMIATSPPSALRHDAVASNLGQRSPRRHRRGQLIAPLAVGQRVIELSRKRRQSVGQIIRSMIGHALHDGAE